MVIEPACFDRQPNTPDGFEIGPIRRQVNRLPAMPHPIHLHGKQFQVLKRSGVRHEGYVDEGWKDTVLLMPGERIRILVKFGDYPGLFLYHCHNLEHEDMGMMRNYRVENRTSAA